MAAMAMVIHSHTQNHPYYTISIYFINILKSDLSVTYLIGEIIYWNKWKGVKFGIEIFEKKEARIVTIQVFWKNVNSSKR